MKPGGMFELEIDEFGKLILRLLTTFLYIFLAYSKLQ